MMHEQGCSLVTASKLGRSARMGWNGTEKMENSREDVRQRDLRLRPLQGVLAAPLSPRRVPNQASVPQSLVPEPLLPPSPFASPPPLQAPSP
jgi:hypothetical protein